MKLKEKKSRSKVSKTLEERYTAVEAKYTVRQTGKT